MKGWFDAFRNDGGPTLYTYSNRTPVTGDVNTISIILVFSTLLVAFLVIFPGIRKERFSTFLSVILSLYIGTVILATNNGSTWHVGTTIIHTTYRAYYSDKLHAHLGAYIGLTHVNVTLKVIPESNDTRDIDYNERFYWIGSHDMGNSYKESLRRGLPFPILTVAEYLSFCQEGFNWGAHYRAAGYYAGVTLWAAFALWLVMNLLLIVVPRYGAYAMSGTGSLMLLSVLIYWYKLPPQELIVRIEASELRFRCGACFYIVLYSGIICVLTGLIIAVIDCIFPHKFSTILEVDYDTPYDRHIIIDDSHERRDERKQRKLEDPPPAGIGTKLLRRLSKRSQLEGITNDTFEMDPPKSPWRYPFRPTAFPALNGQSTSSMNGHHLNGGPANGHHMNGHSSGHLNSGTSNGHHLSSNGANGHHMNGNGTNGHHYSTIGANDRHSGGNGLGQNSRDVGTDPVPVRNHIQLSRPPLRTPKYPFHRQMSTDSHDSVATDHSGSSLGLSFLNRLRESTRIPPSPLATTHNHHDRRRDSEDKRNDMW